MKDIYPTGTNLILEKPSDYLEKIPAVIRLKFAQQDVIKAAETCIKQIQYGFGPDLETLERAVLTYWQTGREARKEGAKDE